MEALFEFTQVDPNRNVFETMITMEASSTPTWVETVAMTKNNYTDIAIRYVSNYCFNIFCFIELRDREYFFFFSANPESIFNS